MLWIGLDEAGYGPMLGPLVVGCAIWRVPDETPIGECGKLFKKLTCADQPTAAWEKFAQWKSKQATAKKPNSPAAALKKLPPLWLTDSKKIHQPAAPERLERAAWPLWELVHGPLYRAHDARQLWIDTTVPDNPQGELFDCQNDDEREGLSNGSIAKRQAEGSLRRVAESGVSHAANNADIQSLLSPFFLFPSAPPLHSWDWHDDLRCPQHAKRVDWPESGHYRQRFADCGITLVDLRVRVMMPSEFNRTIARVPNKATLLSHVTLGLLAELLRRHPGEPVFIEADKHGGRDSYAGLLQQHWPDAEIVTHHESRPQSRYNFDNAVARTIHFAARGESSLATACASLAAKSIRELAMHGFNKYWRGLQPDLRPTAGYNVDAGRFLEDTAELRQRLGIPDENLIRCR